MTADTKRRSFFIGWDVGGWNCDKNSNSRDAIVILDDELALVGKPWRGNLRDSISNATTSADWWQSLFGKCNADCPTPAPLVTMAIDTPLGFSVEFTNLITGHGHVEPHPTSGLNRYLFRHAERAIFESGKQPLSAIKDMIGSQATKGMHALAKFAPHIESCGVWTDGQSFHAIEAYPAACRETDAVRRLLDGHSSLGNEDKDDARVCAVMAYLFATQRQALEPQFH
jgi:hypothetical protein